jgi:hypothetical protein
MNEPWNRFVLRPSTTSLFDEDLRPSAIQPVPNGGILGNFGQDAGTPPMGLWPATTAPVRRPWSQTWPLASPAQTPDPDTLRFHAAWRRLYSLPASSARWLPGTWRAIRRECHIISNIRAGLHISSRRRAAASCRSVLRSMAATRNDIGGAEQRSLFPVSQTGGRQGNDGRSKSSGHPI